jgi:hypothetical protein
VRVPAGECAVGPFGGTLEKTQRGFEAMNQALKARAEARV